jgi:dihydroneopterin aldolase
VTAPARTPFADTAYTKIVLKDVEVSARVGLASWERERPQRLIVNVELYAEPKDYLGYVTPRSIIDYYKLYDRIQSWRVRAHTDLVETLVSDLLDAGFDAGECVPRVGAQA